MLPCCGVAFACYCKPDIPRLNLSFVIDMLLRNVAQPDLQRSVMSTMQSKIISVLRHLVTTFISLNGTIAELCRDIVLFSWNQLAKHARNVQIEAVARNDVVKGAPPQSEILFGDPGRVHCVAFDLGVRPDSLFKENTQQRAVISNIHCIFYHNNNNNDTGPRASWNKKRKTGSGLRTSGARPRSNRRGRR